MRAYQVLDTLTNTRPLLTGSRKPVMQAHAKRLNKWHRDNGGKGARYRVVVALESVTAKAKKRVQTTAHGKRGRKNPEEAAAALYEKFHGKPPDGYKEFEVKRHFHKHVAELGKLLMLHIELANGSSRKLKARGITLASSEDGGQLYFLGGDQALDLAEFGLERTLPKDFVRVGRVWEIAYHTKKGFHNFEPVDYYHYFGKGSAHTKPGEPETWPELVYDVQSQLVFLVGGVYQVKPEGIVN